MNDSTNPTPSGEAVSEAKHTPGPWVAKLACFSNREPFGFKVEAPRRAHSVANAGVYEATNLLVPDPVPADMREQFYTRDELAANAHLIAAAPDLLDALRQLRESALHTMAAASGWEASMDTCVERANAAIAKATGSAA